MRLLESGEYALIFMRRECYKHLLSLLLVYTLFPSGLSAYVCSYCGYSGDTNWHHCGRGSSGSSGGYNSNAGAQDRLNQQIQNSNAQMLQQSQAIIDAVGKIKFGNSSSGGYNGYTQGSGVHQYPSDDYSPSYDPAIIQQQQVVEAERKRKLAEAQRKAAEAAALLEQAKAQADSVQTQALKDIANQLLADSIALNSAAQNLTTTGTNPGNRPGIIDSLPAGLCLPPPEGFAASFESLEDAINVTTDILKKNGLNPDQDEAALIKKLESMPPDQLARLTNQILETLPPEVTQVDNPYTQALNERAWDNRDLIAQQERRLHDVGGKQSELDEWGEGLRERQLRAERELREKRITETEYHDRMSGISDERARWSEQQMSNKTREVYGNWQLERLNGTNPTTEPPLVFNEYPDPAFMRESVEYHNKEAHRTGLEFRQNKLNKAKAKDQITGSAAARIQGMINDETNR